MDTNISALIATALFIVLPTSFLVVLYVKTTADTAKFGSLDIYFSKLPNLAVSALILSLCHTICFKLRGSKI